jgi:hypothetical protein
MGISFMSYTVAHCATNVKSTLGSVAAFFGINLAYNRPILAIPAFQAILVFSNLLIPRTRAMYDIY